MRTTGSQSGLARRCVALLACVSLCLTPCACTTLRQVPMASTPATPPAVEVGDSVQIDKNDGTRVSFQVTAVEPDALVGDGVRVLYSEIAVLQAKRVAAARTAGLGAGILIGIGIAVGLATISLLSVANDEP